MKILFLSSSYRGLYKPVEQEMRRQGHDVTLFLPPPTSTSIIDPYSKVKHFKFREKFRALYNKYICDTLEKCWREQIKNSTELSDSYDLFFVLGSFVVSNVVVNHLRQYNPNIKTVYYAWDSMQWYDSSPMLDTFDRVYSFDLRDCRAYNNLHFLPNYWIEDKPQQKKQLKEYKYDFFFIGLNSTGRYAKIKKLAAYMKEHNYTYCIRIIDEGYFLKTLKEKFIYFTMKLFFKDDEEYWSYISYHKEDDEYHIKSNRYVYGSDYKHLEDSSHCVIDVPLSIQSGMPPRFMWALAHGKKILTTSPWALEHPFVSPSQVLVVDLNNIQIPSEFLTTPLTSTPDLSFCRLDNWVKTLINLK